MEKEKNFYETPHADVMEIEVEQPIFNNSPVYGEDMDLDQLP